MSHSFFFLNKLLDLLPAIDEEQYIKILFRQFSICRDIYKIFGAGEMLTMADKEGRGGKDPHIFG